MRILCFLLKWYPIENLEIHIKVLSAIPIRRGNIDNFLFFFFFEILWTTLFWDNSNMDYLHFLPSLANIIRIYTSTIKAV